MNESITEIIMSDLAKQITQLEDIIEKLLDPKTGCPWDIKQTPKSITGNILEESHELMEALAAESPADIEEEAGDVMFQVAFVGALAKRRWGFDLSRIIEGVSRKMVSRHPHVFGEGAKLSTDQEVLDQWQAIKRRDKQNQSLLASVPSALPALQKAHRLSDKAGRAGFDWDGWAAVRQSVDQELGELDELLPGYDRKTVDDNRKEKVKGEMGDLLFTLANLCRHLGFSAEDALSESNRKFIRRFNYIEEELKAKNQRPEEAGLEAMDELWNQAKAKGL